MPGSPLTPCIVVASVEQWRWDSGRKDVAECLSTDMGRKMPALTLSANYIFLKEIS